jgi:hypothetical protein
MDTTMTNAPLTFRPACETDLFEIVEMLADEPLGELREDLRAPLPEASRLMPTDVWAGIQFAFAF